MTQNNLQQTADIFNQLILESQTTQLGNTANAGNPGQWITATFPGHGTVRGRCGNTIAPGQVEGWLCADGHWELLSPYSPTPTGSRTTIRHRRTIDKKKGMEMLMVFSQTQRHFSDPANRVDEIATNDGKMQLFAKWNNRPLALLTEPIQPVYFLALWSFPRPLDKYRFSTYSNFPAIMINPVRSGLYVMQLFQQKDLNTNGVRWSEDVLYSVRSLLISNGNITQQFDFEATALNFPEAVDNLSVIPEIPYPTEFQAYLPYMTKRAAIVTYYSDLPYWNDFVPQIYQADGGSPINPRDFIFQNKRWILMNKVFELTDFGWNTLLKSSSYQLAGESESLKTQITEVDLTVMGLGLTTQLVNRWGEPMSYTTQDFIDRPTELRSAYGNSSNALTTIQTSDRLTAFAIARGING
ncbi:MAG TPA: hypothetical protein V6C65_04490 [Allocoleopsis sp.]